MLETATRNLRFASRRRSISITIYFYLLWRLPHHIYKHTHIVLVLHTNTTSLSYFYDTRASYNCHSLDYVATYIPYINTLYQRPINDITIDVSANAAFICRKESKASPAHARALIARCGDAAGCFPSSDNITYSYIYADNTLACGVTLHICCVVVAGDPCRYTRCVMVLYVRLTDDKQYAYRTIHLCSRRFTLTVFRFLF